MSEKPISLSEKEVLRHKLRRETTKQGLLSSITDLLTAFYEKHHEYPFTFATKNDINGMSSQKAADEQDFEERLVMGFLRARPELNAAFLDPNGKEMFNKEERTEIFKEALARAQTKIETE